MITASELTAMQATQALTLTETATIARRTYTTDGLGGQTEASTSTSTTCRLAASTLSPDREMLAGRIVEGPLWRITFAQGTDVRADDKITIGARSFEVLGVLAPITNETARVCVAAERR